MKGIYDIIIIGAGSGGLNVASFMNRAGFSVLLIDKTDANIGGDCLNFGCVPSKALIHISRLMYNAKEAKRFGLDVKGSVDIKKVTKYITEKKNIIRKHENAAYFRKKGMDVVLGEAEFFGKNEVKVGKKVYKGKKIVLATGSRPRELKVQGIEKVEKYDNEDIFDIKKLPKRFLVVGGGPIGVELGQALHRLGSKVTIVQRGPQFLEKDDEKVSAILYKQLVKEGIEVHLSCAPVKFLSKNKVLVKRKGGGQLTLDFDAVLVAIGRELNIPKGIEKAGIKLTEDKRKLKVNDYLQSTNKNVYLCGDVAGGLQFTHAAELHTAIIINNMVSPFKKKLSYDNFSWVTFTSPEIATFGIDEMTLKKRGIKYEKLSYDLADDDRAIVEESTEGLLMIYISNDKILGGTMIGKNAGEIVQELILANVSDLDIKNIFNKIYAYPVASRMNKRIVMNHFRKKLTPFAKSVIRFFYKF